MRLPETVLDEAEAARHGWVNFWRSLCLLAGLLAVFSTVSWLVAGPDGFWISAGAVVFYFAAGARASSAILLRMFRARPLHPADAPRLYALLEGVCARAGLRTLPELYYIPDSAQANAFTVGTAGRPRIALSDALLSSLTEREMAGVLAHEVSHVLNGDLKIMSLAHLLSRMIAAIASFLQLAVVLYLPLILAGYADVDLAVLLLAAAAPPLALYLQMQLSQTREFDADRTAVGITEDPDGLASALYKIGYFFRDPLAVFFLWRREEPGPKWLRTHPDTEERIARVLRMRRKRRHAVFEPGGLVWLAGDLLDSFRRAGGRRFFL